MKKKSFILIGIVLMIMVLLTSYYFEPNYVSYDEKTEISIMVNGEYTDTFPQKGSGLSVENITCDNGASGMWDEENWTFLVKDLMSTHTKCKISFFRKYEEEILHGTDPVLKEGLIPVTISDNGVVHKANVSEEWYNYANQKWANAVILEDESITYENYEEIPEENIESYFVWIPRYKYQLFNLGEYTSVTSVDKNAKTIINVEFGMDTTDDANDGQCTTPMESGETGNCKVGDYMTHPAFLAFDVKGIWVGKFETGYKGATSKNEVHNEYVENETPDKIQVKPNVYSWRNISVSNAHLNAYNYKREYDSHMMKNTEWGAVAYLQHSIYGSRKKVRINNNSNFITGYASKNEPTKGYTATNDAGNKYQGTDLGKDGTYTYNYQNPLSVVASTTNNYSGIYDMSGGGYDMVMGIMKDSSGNLPTGIDYPEEEKYYDIYEYTNSENYRQYNKRILGDATGEMGPFGSIMDAGYGGRYITSWYSAEARFVFEGKVFFGRGSGYGVGLEAGVYAFSYINNLGGGTATPFRIVLAF